MHECRRQRRPGLADARRLPGNRGRSRREGTLGVALHRSCLHHVRPIRRRSMGRQPRCHLGADAIGDCNHHAAVGPTAARLRAPTRPGMGCDAVSEICSTARSAARLREDGYKEWTLAAGKMATRPGGSTNAWDSFRTTRSAVIPGMPETAFVVPGHADVPGRWINVSRCATLERGCERGPALARRSPCG